MGKENDKLGGRVFPHDLEAFCVRAMLKAGIAEDIAQTTGEVLVTTDTWGIYTHGSRQLRGLLRNFRKGRLDVKARPEVVEEGAAWGLVDGKNSMPPTTAYMAMELALQKAKGRGIAYVGVRGSSHFGAAGFYASMALCHDMIGLSMSNVEPWMTVPGARGRVLGTNPIAFAIPAGKEKPILLDIATSAVALTKVFAAKSQGKPVPEGWIVDNEGHPTSDASIFPESGALLPMAGHKGYGLALLAEVLSGVITGAAVTNQIQSWALDLPGPSNQGHAFVAIDVGTIMPVPEFKGRVDRMIQDIKESPKATGSERIYLPGEMEWERRERAFEHGMQLPQDVVLSLRGLAEDMELEWESALWAP